MDTPFAPASQGRMTASRVNATIPSGPWARKRIAAPACPRFSSKTSGNGTVACLPSAGLFPRTALPAPPASAVSALIEEHRRTPTNTSTLLNRRARRREETDEWNEMCRGEAFIAGRILVTLWYEVFGFRQSSNVSFRPVEWPVKSLRAGTLPRIHREFLKRVPSLSCSPSE